MEEENHEHRFPRFLAGVYPATCFGNDVADIPSITPCISKLDIFLLVSSIIMHIVDMLFDYNIAVRYFLSHKIAYFTWTICLIIIPSLINVIVSTRMQRQDKEINSSKDILDYKTTYIMIRSRLYFVIAVLLQLAPVIHYYDTLKYALKARRCNKSKDRAGERCYYIQMLKEDQDVALLRIFECFLEAAPQQILQLTLMLKHYHNKVNFEFAHQIGSIVSSFFLWHICITVARIISLSVIASIWPIYTIICCVIHWIIMTIWILVESHGILEFCRNYGRPPHMQPTFKERFYSILFATIIGIVHIFIYFNTIDSNTFWKHICFYIVCFLENVVSNLLSRYISPCEIRTLWYFDAFFIISISVFLLGITAMILYYTTFHPSKKQHDTVSDASQAIQL